MTLANIRKNVYCALSFHLGTFEFRYAQFIDKDLLLLEIWHCTLNQLTHLRRNDYVYEDSIANGSSTLG